MAYRVLIVDDSPAMRTFVRRVIDMSGFDLASLLRSRLTARKHWTCCAHEWVDAILTDINMPVMDGRSFCGAYREDEVLRSIPAIVISTDATAHRWPRWRLSGRAVTSPNRSCRKLCAPNWNAPWGCLVNETEMRRALRDSGR